MKQWIDLESQVERHLDRGLELGEVSREAFAHFLYSNNYYRVSGYARCFYEGDSEYYAAGTTARHIIDVYALDREVRNAVLRGIAIVEPTVRSRVAFHLAREIGGGDVYLSPDLYLPTGPENGGNATSKRHARQVENREKVLRALQAVQERPEIFIKHHVAKGRPVPFWAVVEVLSFGDFSRLLRALRNKSPLDPVRRSLGIEDMSKFLQAIQNVAFLRNIAAHHGRLWNRRFSGHVTLPKIALDRKRAYLSTLTPAAALTLLAALVDQIQKTTEFSTHLLDLIHSRPEYLRGYYEPML